MSHDKDELVLKVLGAATFLSGALLIADILYQIGRLF